MRQAGDDEGAGKSGHLEADAASPDEIDEMLMIDERHGEPNIGLADFVHGIKADGII